MAAISSFDPIATYHFKRKPRVAPLGDGWKTIERRMHG